VKKPDGAGRVAAFEVLVATSAVRNLIREGKTYQLPSVIQTASNQGMVDLDQSLARLTADGLADPEDARAKSANPSQFDQHVAYLESRAAALASSGQPPASS
jgi:twitching motility protein PilT